MIVLFNGHSLTVRERFQAEAFSLQLSERQSTATLTISDSAPAISVDNWLMVESGPGARIVWRVRAIDEQYDRKTRTVQLEHTIQTLKDRLMFGEVTSKAMGGSDSACSARSAVSYILRQQSDWRLGDFAYNVNNPYNFNGDDLLSALETVSGSLDNCIWEYDFASYPFTLHIRKHTDSIASEMRMDRNIRTLKKTIDRSRMYTRIYPIGKNNLHIDGNYLSKNENLYGVVCKTETDQSQDTKEKLKLWAQERLNNHCEPSVTVTISGLELADATGEPLDSFTIGRICRVPLPEFSTTITERVSKLSYPDAIKDPENVTITLANELIDVATIIKQQNASGGRGGRAAAKNDEEKHAWIINEQDHVGLLAEAVAGPGADQDWSRVSEILVDGKGIHQRVTKTEGDIVTAEAKIEVNENAIKQEVTKRTSETSSLSSRITQEAGRITQEVTDRKNADTSMSSRITQEANRISLVVEGTGANAHIKPASIVASINNGSSTIKLSADHIDIDGLVNRLDAYDITAKTLKALNTSVFDGEVNFNEGASFNGSDVTDITNLDADNATFGSLTVAQGSTYREASWKSFTYRHVQLSTERAFLWGSTSGIMGSTTGRIPISYTDTTIYYLGR